jgi:hypothetical protein
LQFKFRLGWLELAFKMNTPQDLIKWLNEGNTDKVNEVLLEISGKDKRRLN